VRANAHHSLPVTTRSAVSGEGSCYYGEGRVPSPPDHYSHARRRRVRHTHTRAELPPVDTDCAAAAVARRLKAIYFHNTTCNTPPPPPRVSVVSTKLHTFPSPHITIPFCPPGPTMRHTTSPIAVRPLTVITVRPYLYVYIYIYIYIEVCKGVGVYSRNVVKTDM
jgi:hypothetical protein